MQPGDSVQPGNSPDEPSWQFNPNAQPNPTQPPAPAPVASSPAPQPSNIVPATPPTDSNDGVVWTASEFIAHQKNSGWYLILFSIAFVFAGLIFLLTRDIVSSTVVIIFAAMFAFVASRKPRQLQYHVDDHGLQIGDKDYPYNSFRSFAIVQEEGVESIWFMPLKRFRPIVSIYFDPRDGDQIVIKLNQNLPLEDHEPELVDRLMHRIRF